MDIYNLQRAISEGRLPFRVFNGKETRYVLATSFEQCQSKFTKWNIEEIAMKDYINSRLSDVG